MTRNEMILSIASEIVGEQPKINFKEAQELAEKVLKLIENSGIMNTSKYGAICSRCGIKGYDCE